MQIDDKDIEVLVDMASDAVGFYKALMVTLADLDLAIEMVRDAHGDGVAKVFVDKMQSTMTDPEAVSKRFDALAKLGQVALPPTAFEADAVIQRLKATAKG